MTLYGVLASVLYGGIVEEIMLRLFVMSLIAFILAKLFCCAEDELPAWVFVTANFIAAVLFAAGHLPATVTTFGTLTPMILIRCFLFNGGFGILFGHLYRRYGIQYAMISHALLHILSKLIWALFL
ncbi:MAG: CPBP family intramembrane metalloprotease [Clostridia bacterium]|nr:CPBP family intramembrane metalloprotease [Clostridia bacterium]MBQ8370881.1 CPBP family intramembrane metalloprotease [Clostridia bacterium]